MRQVEVVPYNLNWPKLFEEEAQSIRNVMKNIIVNIHHIGSTSIPGMAAKPIIDIMIEVESIEKVDSYNQEMIQLGYDPQGENGIPNRRYFSKGGDNRTHHVHIFQTGNPEVERHLLFRDYLIVHPEEAKSYSNLKKSLSLQFPFDIEQYIDGKDCLIKELDEKAKAWKYKRS
ncbi:GrpB family protein [Bacillus sp. FJAT-49736]|uniref:GrpB family protein n=1 Tax=Bacillus sp. FJAT-49736 TaxID=2833582 RepID=UPI001BC9995B|nr:GrpB family protein [Bacillus sp. FJAT-49736]MBS4175615.1 GrpB family protein [Bacillus sp. FJAT-49736]